MRILVADDDKVIRLILKRMLEKWDYEVEIVENGLQAWGVIDREDPPGIVLVDWMMPIMDGIELCQKLQERRRNARGKYIHAILLTSRNDAHDIMVGLNSGADDFISKPANPDELRSRLQVGERAIDYENRLLVKEKETRLECYRALTQLAEKRDEETGHHIERLRSYCDIVGEALAMSQTFMEDLHEFSPMHDIGKVGIPDNILRAPRRLTPEEFAIMKTHSTLGYEILVGRPSMEMAADICHAHHEKWSGNGYPQGLREDEIPLAAQIVSLADVYDALRSRRPYKQPWTHERTAKLIYEEKGKQFSPAVATVFMDKQDAFNEHGKIFEEPGGDYSSVQE